MNWKVRYIDLGAQYQALKGPLDEAMQRIMASGRYINGEETERFEESLARYLGVKHVIGVGNGYDALFLAIRTQPIASGQILTDEYTHISTIAAIVHATHSKVIYRERDASNLQARVPVHMNGRVNNEAQHHSDVPVIEDACQAIGAKFAGQFAGTFGDAGCFSFHPMKVLGCAGDGGAVATSDSYMNTALRNLRNHGGVNGFGYNSRLDNLQAAILNVKLPYLDGWIKRRREIASIYHLSLPEWVKKPPPPSDGQYFDTYSSYVIGGSPSLLAYLREKGIECFSHIRTDVVSLPIYPEMKDAHIAMVIAAVKAYANG